MSRRRSMWIERISEISPSVSSIAHNEQQKYDHLIEEIDAEIKNAKEEVKSIKTAKTHVYHVLNNESKEYVDNVPDYNGYLEKISQFVQLINAAGFVVDTKIRELNATKESEGALVDNLINNINVNDSQT